VTVVLTRDRAEGWGGGAAAGDGLGVGALGARGVLASVSQASMMKRTVGTCGMLQVHRGDHMSESVAIGLLGVAVSLRRFLDLESFGEEEEGWEEDGNVVGVNGHDH